MSEPKILALGELMDAVATLRARGRRVVHVQGVFDLLHRRHIQRLEGARRQGDLLVVTIKRDADAEAAGHRPIVGERLRAETLAALPCVDHVAIEDGPTGLDCVRRLHPHVYAHGVDALASPDAEVASARSVVSEGGGVFVAMDDTAPLAQSEDRPPVSPEADAFLRAFRERYRAADVLEALRGLSQLKVLVVGDAIVDEYHFCRPYGMPQKAPVIAAQFLAGESYPGGILAVANHVAGFCAEVHLVTCLGAMDTKEDLVRGALAANVTARLFHRPDAPTTVKRRYVRKFLVQRLFEVGFFNDSPIPADIEREVCAYVEARLGDYDLVIVADYGHGLLTPRIIETLTAGAPFLAVNAQLNSVNFGFHLVTKYRHADYVCIDENELRLACRDRWAGLPQLLSALATQMDAPLVTVTRGHHGSLTYRPGEPMVEVPVFSRDVVDTLGAGDAYLSLTAPCARLGFAPDLMAFIGNAGGALAVRVIGNQKPVRPEPLFNLIANLLG